LGRLEGMKKLTVLVMLFVLAIFPLAVNAEGDVEVDTTIGVDAVISEGEEGVLVSPNNKFFGLSWAFMQVSESIERMIAFSEEKKTEVEMKYAQRELRLKEMVQEKNQERYQVMLNKLNQRHEKRVNRLEQRVERLGERKEEFKQKVEQYKVRWEARNEDENQDGVVPVQVEQGSVDAGERVDMKGSGVQIQNARPGKVEVR